jgi:hypothetical protein
VIQPISEGRDVCARGRGNYRKDDVKDMRRDIKEGGARRNVATGQATRKWRET